MTRIERLKLLASAIAGDFKSLRLKLGNTDELVTDDKTSAVKAINEVAGSSKEIKDAMKQFSENLGFDKEITKVNNVSINPFEMLVPFIKDKLAEEGITNVDAEKNTQNYFFVFFDDTIKTQHGSNFSKNKYGIKLKQNTYDKFVKFDVSANNVINVSLPQEINTSQDIELDIYGILGHYMSDYKIMPYTKYIKQLNIPSDRVIVVNSLEEHEGRSYSTDDDDILVLVKTNLNELSDMTNSIEKLFKLQDGQNITNKSYGFINQDATKYFDFTTREWLPLKDLISSDMQYNIMLSILQNPVDANEIKYINEAWFTHTSGLNKINIAAENSAILNTVLTKPLYKDNFNIILNPELTKYYNNVTKQWNELPYHFKNQFNYLKNVDTNINIATSENNIDVANKTTQTELETDSHSRTISVVDKNKVTNLSELDNDSMLSTSYNTTLVVDKTLNYVLNKNTRTWVKINSEQSQKIKDKVTIDFSLTINDTTAAEKIKCRTRVNTFSKSGSKNILVYDKNNTNLEDIASVNYSIYDGDIVIDKTYTYYLNPYTSVWYELPNEVKTKLNNFVNTQYTKVVTRLKEKTNSLNIINLNEDLTDVRDESVYLVSNKENIKFRANNDYAYNFNDNTLIFTEDLSEYLDIPTQEWKQVIDNYTPSIVYSVCENIVAVITNKVLNTLDYRNPVTLINNNLTEIKNQIKDKEVVINKTYKNLINESTIDLSKVKFYSMSKSDQGNSNSAIHMLQKYPNIKIFNAGGFVIQINNKLAELLNKNNTIAILTKKSVSASHDFEIAYKGKRYQLSQDNFFINNIENLCQFIGDDDWL
jgi:hypothetical protein